MLIFYVVIFYIKALVVFRSVMKVSVSLFGQIRVRSEGGPIINWEPHTFLIFESFDFRVNRIIFFYLISVATDILK